MLAGSPIASTPIGGQSNILEVLTLLTIEDGTIVDGANCFGDSAGADTYHNNLGQTSWIGTLTVKEQAIVRAMRYLEALEPSMRGTRVNTTQELAWPRYQAVDKSGNNIASNTVPTGWVNAMYEAALIELISPGSLQPELELGGSPVLSKSVKAGSVSISRTYQGGYDPRKRFLIIDEMIAPYLDESKEWGRS